MMYVYILQSLASPDRHYVGATADLRARLKKHNAGDVSHTSKYAPWVIKTAALMVATQKAKRGQSPFPCPLRGSRGLGLLAQELRCQRFQRLERSNAR
jgi:hypothetical protein